jgi:hypothetical protein
MQMPSGAHKLKLLKQFPIAPTGYGDVEYKIDGLNLEVMYQCHDREGEYRTGKLVFEFFVALCIESANNDNGWLPPDSDTLYGFESNEREGFRGYQVWFSDNDLITVSCQRVLVENEVY